MLEIELKFPAATFDAVAGQLAQWQARPEPAIDEADHYFNAPDRDFARTDEAFRLRRIGEGNFITYKGPKQAGSAKTRAEIELPLADGAHVADDFCRLVHQLGYRSTAVVRKRRTIWRFQRAGFDLQACLDEVAEVGRFVELEIVAPPERRADAERLLQALALELGLRDAERRSYLEMLLERRVSS